MASSIRSINVFWLLAIILISTPGKVLADVESNGNVMSAERYDIEAVANERQASAVVNEVKKKLEDQFDVKPEYVKAKADLTTAQAAYTAAHKAVIDNLQSDPIYQAAVAAHSAAHDEVKNAQADGVTGQEMMDKAEAELNAGQAVTKLEIDALANDPTLKEAKTNLDSAKAVVNQLDQQFQLTLATNVEYQWAKGDFDKARINRQMNDEKLDAARNAAAAEDAEHARQVQNEEDAQNARRK